MMKTLLIHPAFGVPTAGSSRAKAGIPPAFGGWNARFGLAFHFLLVLCINMTVYNEKISLFINTLAPLARQVGYKL
jgi:hypothetical protein